jgi:hypothetical protein
MICSDPWHIHMWDAVSQGAYICMLKEERACIVGKDMEDLSEVVFPGS